MYNSLLWIIEDLEAVGLYPQYQQTSLMLTLMWMSLRNEVWKVDMAYDWDLYEKLIPGLPHLTKLIHPWSVEQDHYSRSIWQTKILTSRYSWHLHLSTFYEPWFFHATQRTCASPLSIKKSVLSSLIVSMYIALIPITCLKGRQPSDGDVVQLRWWLLVASQR